MNRRKFIISTGAFLLVFMLLTGYVAVAAEYGSKDDPLVTLSYVTDVLAPETLKQMDAVVAEKTKAYTADMTSKMTAYSGTLDTKMKELDNTLTSVTASSEFINKVADAVIKKGGVSSSAAQWKVVKVASGQTLKAEIGTELVLRIGTASCYATGTPGLINLSSGGTVNSGGALSKNNLYLVTVKDRGLKASDAVTVLVCGGYTIS